ncbi:GNAT family N-acetyltransferase [Pseudarthrobacter sp. Y6]|uniref:GNAT family N-acetyltransferase n=1 Tax=Pseudarthrobacter sp. Y6 TaxID=3418422 RepID=UPI003CE96E0A
MHHESVLTGYGLSLLPLAPHHAEGLFDFVDATMWAGMAAPLPATAHELSGLFAARIEDPASLAFAVLDQRTGALLGTTALNAFEAAQQRVEVGGTFFGRQFWGTQVNPPASTPCLSLRSKSFKCSGLRFAAMHAVCAAPQLQHRLEPFALAGDPTGGTDYARRTFAAL